MPLILGYVSVTDAELGLLKQIHNVKHTIGPDQRYQQVAGLGDPQDPNAVAGVASIVPATTAFGLVVRPAPPNFNSGLATLPTVITSIVGTDLRVDRLYLVNTTDQVRQVSITNGIGTDFLKTHDLPAFGFINLNLGRMLFDGGLKWMAAAAGTINGQVVGDI